MALVVKNRLGVGSRVGISRSLVLGEVIAHMNAYLITTRCCNTLLIYTIDIKAFGQTDGYSETFGLSVSLDFRSLRP